MSSDQPTRRIVTWNVHGSAKPDPGQLTEILTSFRPDIVCLQEIRYEQAHQMSHHLGFAHPFWMVKHNPYIGRPKLAEGLAIIATEEIEHGHWVKLSKFQPLFSYKRRIMQWATIPGSDGAPELTLINTHLSTDAKHIGHQVEVLIAAAPPNAVLAGDLNHAANSGTLRSLEAHGWRNLGSISPAHCVDFVLTPQSWRAASIPCEIPQADIKEVSDHTPVGMEVWPTSEHTSITTPGRSHSG